MKTKLLTIVAALALATTALAHGDGTFGGSGDYGLGDLSGHHRGFGGFGGDFSSNLTDNAELLQTHFQTKFDNLETQYNDGVANTTDFFTTTTYDSIVNKTESLSDRYDFFVDGVQNTIDRLGDVITKTNDDITFYNNLLTNYQGDTDISASKLARIELFINHITDRLNSKVDTLTTEQSTLQTNLPTYQSFQTDLTKFLSDIQTAGGASIDSGTDTSGMKAMLTSASSLAASTSSGSSCASTAMSLTATTAPEPSLISLLVILSASGSLIIRRRI